MTSKLENSPLWCKDFFGISAQIKTNRLNFIDQYQITKTSKETKKIKSIIKNERELGILDHLEYYRTPNFIIIVSSPYSDKSKSLYLENGWIESYQLYSVNACSYIKIINLH
jgi:hypothetical protein